MRFPTRWYVWPAKPQISLRIRAIWSEPLLVRLKVHKQKREQTIYVNSCKWVITLVFRILYHAFCPLEICQMLFIPWTQSKLINAKWRRFWNYLWQGNQMVQIYYSQISVIRTSIIRNYWVIRRQRTGPTFFSIIYCNKTTDYSNFDYPKNSILRSDSSVPMKEIAIKITLQDSKSKCHAWWSWFLCLVEFDLTHPSDLANKVATGKWHRIKVHTFTWSTVKWVNGVFN